MQLYIRDIDQPQGPISKSRLLTIDEKRPLGRGATATVYNVVAKGLAGQVAKIYHKRQQFDGDKIRAMLATRPPLKYDAGGREIHPFAWPSSVVYDDRNIPVGYLMPHIGDADSLPLNFFFERLLAKSKLPASEQSLTARLRLARNLSALLATLHEHGHYVIDFKPQNTKVFVDGLFVAILDCDSFSIKSDANARFPATNYTSEYIAPEALLGKQRPFQLDEQQDRFALAVVLFQLLNNGVHPFQGIMQSDSDQSSTDDRVRGGFYPYGRRPHPRVKPCPQSIHEFFDDRLRELFDRAFTGPPASRPAASEWSALFKQILTQKMLQPCPQFPADPTHIRFEGKPCGLCHFDGILRSKLPPPPPPPNPSQQRICGKCGRAVAMQLLVCPACGSHSFRQGTPSTGKPGTTGGGTVKKRGVPKVLWYAGAAALVVGAAVLLGPAIRKPPTPSPQPVDPPRPYVPPSPQPSPSRPALPAVVGPSFDCSLAPVANQPLAQMLCASTVLSRADRNYVIAYWALNGSLNEQGQRNLVADSDRFQRSVTDSCGIPRSGTIYRDPTSDEVSCILGWYNARRAEYVRQLTGGALEEAQLTPEEAIAIQTYLQRRGFLPQTEKIDGAFGNATRRAILGWQSAAGVAQTGFGSRAMLVALSR